MREMHAQIELSTAFRLHNLPPPNLITPIRVGTEVVEALTPHLLDALVMYIPPPISLKVH